MTEREKTYRTRSGKVLTDTDVEAMADEAEQGYDVEALKTRRRGRPLLGSDPAEIVPVPSNLTHVYPFQVRLDASETGLRVDSKAQAEQVRSVAVARVGSRVGRLTPPLLAALDEALRLHLAL